MKAISILVADDHGLVRSGARTLLERQPGWKVIGEAADGREAVLKAKELQPDIVVLDIGMPGLNGLDATRRILRILPRTKILILTMHDDQELMQRTVLAGALGYVLKSDAEEDLVSAVRALAKDRTFFPSRALRGALSRSRRRERKHTPALSSRESEILQLLAEGKLNKQVAGILSISQRTVENHRAKIMQKLHLNSFSSLVRYAVRHKIVEP